MAVGLANDYAANYGYSAIAIAASSGILHGGYSPLLEGTSREYVNPSKPRSPRLFFPA